MKTFALVLMLSWRTLCSAYSQAEVSTDGETLNLDQLAGYGRLIHSDVMEELQRLHDLQRDEAVQAIVLASSLLAVSDPPAGKELPMHIRSFEEGMEGVTFMGVEDTPEHARYRRAMFVAACRTLAQEDQDDDGYSYSGHDPYDAYADAHSYGAD